MKSKVAVATVQGKAYFLIVNELKRRNIRFISLLPKDSIPTGIKVVITTTAERQCVNHSRVLVYDVETDPEVMGSQVVKILQGKESYEKIVIGVDPGVVFGLAVIADGAVIDVENCFSLKDVATKIRRVLRTVDFNMTVVTVKIGNGVPVYKALVEMLDGNLPCEVLLEIVSEAGTNHHAREAKQRRGFRHIFSAIKIAGREGYAHQRRQLVEEDG
ncbi:MAG: hypothetical protein N3D85_06625 [Candidatus Bathyarchaeota archaeon]|nr:hypothetical protein [Candidatus Bathyarchaeota archaeon]